MHLEGIRRPAEHGASGIDAPIDLDSSTQSTPFRLRLVLSAHLLIRRTCSPLEIIVAGLLLLGAGFAVYGVRVVRGGFMLDDWALAADHKRFGGFFAMAHHLLGNSALVNAGGRPLAALYFGTSYSLFGSNAALHLAFGIVLSALMSTALYVVLRTLGVERLHAAALALLVLVFPAADAPRLWPTAGQGVLAIFLFLCGVLLAVRAAQLGLKIVDVPVRYHARTYGRTNISRFEHGWMLLKMAISGFVDLKVRPARVWSVRSRTTRLNPR